MLIFQSLFYIQLNRIKLFYNINIKLYYCFQTVFTNTKRALREYKHSFEDFIEIKYFKTYYCAEIKLFSKKYDGRDIRILQIKIYVLFRFRFVVIKLLKFL